MNIIQAIKSGKRFRRPNNNYWLCIDSDGEINFPEIGITWIAYSEDLLAEDWEVEQAPEKSVTVTRSSIMNAFNNRYILCTDDYRAGAIDVLDLLCKQLGLDEEGK